MLTSEEWKEKIAYREKKSLRRKDLLNGKKRGNQTATKEKIEQLFSAKK